jgi:hypothetical protein
MSYGSIYKIVFPNGKHYIGLTTTSLEQRTKEHTCCAKNADVKYLYNAIRKYDMVDTLELIEIDTADTEEELCEKEIGYIIEYNSYYMNGNGYNMTYGGEGTNGYVFTDEVKLKMSEAKKKQFEDHPEKGKEHGERMKKYYEDNPEAREKQSVVIKTYFEDNPEARQKNSEAQKKYFEEHPEAREKMSQIKKTYHEEHPEAGQEHGEKMKTYYEAHPEARQRLSESHKKYHKEHPEARQKMSEIKKQYNKEHPENRKAHSEKMKQYNKEHPEKGKAHSEKMKIYYENNPECIKKTLDTIGKNKPFDVFKNDGTFIKTFTYQFEAKEYLQNEYNITSIISIGSVLEGKRNSSAGFVFKYK